MVYNGKRSQSFVEKVAGKNFFTFFDAQEMPREFSEDALKENNTLLKKLFKGFREGGIPDPTDQEDVKPTKKAKREQKLELSRLNPEALSTFFKTSEGMEVLQAVLKQALTSVQCGECFDVFDVQMPNLPA